MMRTKKTFEKALLLVDHGSRLEEANRVLDEMAARLQSELPGLYVQAAHMERAEPSVEQAFARCAERGVEEIVVFPYFLGPGKHCNEDIPELCRAACEHHPNLSYRITEPLGVHEKIIEVIRERTGL